ncbi:MAG: hypothetical protein NWE89_16905 [Candidatus Bathyarchaeota archaeon]|nr:hypothetical protein [Candidatus Bathyarchaeota archaeon]
MYIKKIVSEDDPLGALVSICFDDASVHHYFDVFLVFEVEEVSEVPPSTIRMPVVCLG